jgi:hypothetical protein
MPDSQDGAIALGCGADGHRPVPYNAAIDLCQRLLIPVPYLSPRNNEEEPVGAVYELKTADETKTRDSFQEPHATGFGWQLAKSL